MPLLTVLQARGRLPHGIAPAELPLKQCTDMVFIKLDFLGSQTVPYTSLAPECPVD